MIDEDFLEYVMQRRKFTINQKSMETALSFVDSALHYLDETDSYESNLLDTAYRELQNCAKLIEQAIKEGKAI